MSIVDRARIGATAAMALSLALGLGACTTVEGTNALVDASTFEREVATETLKGLGVLERENKEVLKTPRAPLALPKDTASLPQPKEKSENQLPEDSDRVQIDASGLTDEDISRLRNARVVDLRSLSGRPLTEVESKQLTACMKAANIAVSTKTSRPLYLPPDEYFTTVGGQDLICLAENGDLVPLTDPACPPEIRAALQSSN
jgi:hypothetical protein